MNSKINKKDLIVKIVLVIVIILLMIHNCFALKKKDNSKTPTGNIDIIEIKCDKEDTCTVEDDKNKDNSTSDNNGDVTDKKPSSNKDNKINKESNTGDKKDNKPSKNTDSKDNEPSGSTNNEADITIPVASSDENTVEEYGLVVDDKSITWNGSAKAKIFTNSMYELDNVISPESSNTYQFVVKNSTEYKLKYEINFIEDNQYNINMKYKLKKNDTYLVDHYVSYDELVVSDVLLNSGTNDTYYLEWKWISSDNDTAIGKNPSSKYELKIEVKAESIDD